MFPEILWILFWFFLFLTSVVLHEVSHGLAAYALGDPTAKQAGRLTLNPFRHVDLFWTIFFPALMFFVSQGRFALGMAKPVPVNFSRLRNPRQGMVWVALAGPFSNLAVAFIFSRLFHHWGSPLLLYGVYLNLGLAIFNLIPVPPMDGSKILAGFLPLRWAYGYLRAEPFGYLAILGLYLSRILFYLMVPGVNLFCRLLNVPVLEM